MATSIQLLDTVDDRREIWHLLHKMPPLRRVLFLQRVCATIRLKDPHGNGPVPMGFAEKVADAERCERGNERLTNAVYADVIAAANQYDLDLVKLACELEQLVKRPRASSARCTP